MKYFAFLFVMIIGSFLVACEGNSVMETTSQGQDIREMFNEISGMSEEEDETNSLDDFCR